MKRLAADDLIVFVPLARNQHQITTSSFGDGLMNRLRAIGNLPVRLACFANSLFSIAQDLLRILRARIIGSKDHDVAQTSRRLTHGRTLRAVAIAATTKYSDDLPFHDFARGAQYIQQRVIAMRIVNDNLKIPVMVHALETSRRAGTLLQSRRDDVETVTQRQTTRDRGQCVVDMRWANER